jgi:hypothetical protein
MTTIGPRSVNDNSRSDAPYCGPRIITYNCDL